MKKHLALFAAFAAIVLMASSAVAQTPAAPTTPAPTTPAATAPAAASAPAAKKGKASGGGAAGKADKDLADLTKTLTLTDDQQAKIKPILADESAKIRAGKKKGSTASADDTKAANKVIRDAANQQIRALLTPDQQKIFDASNKKGAGSKSTPAAAPTT
jgi:Spy/CpxP family protein refolding chaperone